MGRILTIPTHKILTKESSFDGSEYVKTISDAKLISLPSEFDFYVRKFKRVYKIEQSQSSKRWILTTETEAGCWSERGWYVQTLCSVLGWRKYENLFEALERAKALHPNEVAFFCPEAVEWKSNDPEFDTWWKETMLPKLNK